MRRVVELKENYYLTAISITATTVTGWLGGWDIALKVLVVMIVADYLTGVLSALKRKQINSEVMFWGGVRKGVCLLVIAIAVLLDELIGNDAPMFRMLALYFYIAREGLSVVENVGLLGVPMPSFVIKILEQLQEKSDVSIVPKSMQDIDMTLGKPMTAVESEVIKREDSAI
jgi:toxin secretion/phage lysis holin